jgi:sterol desaturase/sphingolipid hydroxylase (fatty acid hydroxylase superfamily)
VSLDPTVLSIPVYLSLIAVELAWDRRHRRGLYRTHDAQNDLACGVFQTVTAALARGLLLAPYGWVYRHWRLLDLSGHPLFTAVLAFVGADFFYYWFHRWSHTCALGWVSHVVHHQSEDYNLAVALRQDAWQPFFSLWFYLPLAAAGVPPEIFVPAHGLMIVLQFWIHTRAITTLGPLEWVLNTPSHHRVHHALNPAYLDRNYAGVFIVWDRLFGSFQPEGEPPRYGTIEPLASWNPAWAHVQYPLKLWATARAAPTLAGALQVPLRPPGWTPPGVASVDFHQLATERQKQPLYDVVVPAPWRPYLWVLFLHGMLLLGVYFAALASLPRPAELTLVFGLFWTFTNLGGLTEARRWALGSEAVRVLWCVGVCVLAVPARPWLVLAAGAHAVLGCWLWWLQTRHPR